MPGESRKKQRSKRSQPPLDRRFTFLGDGTPLSDRKALRSAQYVVLDTTTGFERNLKLWRKTGTAVDEDLRELWLHEMRQVQRVMSYAGAREVIVDIIEFVEDAEEFGVVLEHAGQPLSAKLRHVSRQHWLKNLGAPRPRGLLWRNLKRLVDALGIVHAQGLVHGGITCDSVMTEAAEEPDFQLTGFEWSLWLTADRADRLHAKLNAAAQATRAERYSFAEDWKALGRVAALCLDATVRQSGDVIASGNVDAPLALSTSERLLLRRLVAPTRLDNLDSTSIGKAIEDIIADVARAGTSRAGSFILTFNPASKLAEAVYDASGNEIPIDEFHAQLDWVRGDLDGGATLLVPREFDGKSRLQLVTSAMVYTLTPMRVEGTAVWDIAVCQLVKPRSDSLWLHGQDEHELLQPVEVCTSMRRALETRARLGPDALDWSAFADPRVSKGEPDRVERVRQALLLIQVIEAVLKALEVYPVEILDTKVHDGRRYAILRADPQNERDGFARKLHLTDTAAALKRLFRDDHRDAESKWRLSQAASLGASRHNDVLVSFVDVAEHRCREGYRFDLDDDLPKDGQFFLRPERDAGTEGVITRRLRNIKALTTRVDLAEMLDDAWRVRRSSRDSLDEKEQADTYFQDLDEPKREALLGLWSTLPSYFVVGPPGVGKTRLATETVRRRFANDRSTRLLVTAQGHDALDHLQDEIREVLHTNGLDDVIMVRSSAPERRMTSDEDLHTIAVEYLDSLSQSALTLAAPPPLRDRVHGLATKARRVKRAKDAAEKDDRIAINAVLSLILDAANVVISTANSADVERLVETREQFDWVIVEEAAKATGPELAGPMMLSGRRLLIGDHHQLPPFEAERLVRVLQDHGLVAKAIELADQYVGPLMRDGEIAELEQIAGDDNGIREVADLALRLFEPFRTVVTEDERRLRANPAHRPVSKTLTEQRRMDPAIARIVSHAFYGDALETYAGRAAAALNEPPPFGVRAPLPASPVVVVDFPHVSTTGASRSAEVGRPRWHNPAEVEAILDVLRHVKHGGRGKKSTLAVLSFYNAQVDRLSERIDAEVRKGTLTHLLEFASVMHGGKWVSTVDGFQGNEADLVILSLVRNNAGTGGRALGFLRDKRRMNVALSRAKSKLVIVGSLAFLDEAVRGVNPDAADHDLSFLTRMADAIGELEGREARPGVPCAKRIRPTDLAAARTAC